MIELMKVQNKQIKNELMKEMKVYIRTEKINGRKN